MLGETNYSCPGIPKISLAIDGQVVDLLICEAFVSYLLVEISYLCVRLGQEADWRREGDSNPRNGLPFTHFPGVRLQPLGHPSGQVAR